MAAYTVAVGDVGKYELALAAATEDTVTFGGGAGDAQINDLQKVEILHHSGVAPLYVRFGTTGTATVKGDGCYVVPPGNSLVVEPPTSDDTVVRIISAAVAVYSVASGG